MAEDKLIFPIGFDLEKGVKEAEKNADEYLRRIENAIKKHPISVKVQLDQESKLSSTVKAETQRAAKELTGLKKGMAEINKAWNELSAKDRGGEVGARLIKQYRDLTQEAKGYTSTIGAAVKLEDRLARQREKSAEAATKAAKKTNSSYDEQLSYLSNLLTKMAAVWSVNLVKRFITGIREVTAEFELQRVSLGAIIQDQNRANQLFSEIKTFALKSPVSIMDLTKYTKQLAAYKIETNSLFDTTRRLADVSVGLGVSMDRLILAFGQVKAASYLRSAEIRQFTEAGIPMLELLAEKFTAIQGKAVTTEKVMDMVSKRAVSFSMVEEIFKDMTDAGGMFYNMQETQGNTLFGLWAKLGDAASVMYDQIGNTDFVNKGMKSSILLLTELMRNWRAVSKTAIFAVLPSAAIASLYKYSTATQRVEAAQAAASAATERRKAAALQLSAAIDKGSVDDINAANAALEKAQADEVAAKKGLSRVGLMKSGFMSLAKSFASGLGIGLLITAVTTLIYKFFEAWENAHRLKNTINEIDAERIRLSNQSVRNFTHLADAAVKAADGSKKQKDALNELHRTYKDMIPVQDLTIDRLRAMHGNYTMLTDAIREYINEQQKQKALSAIQEEFGGKQQTAMRKLYDWFDDQGLSSNERERFFREFEKQAEDTSKNLKEKIIAAFESAGIEGGEKLAKSIIKEKGFWSKVLDSSLLTNIITTPTYFLYRKIFPDTNYINDLNKAIAGYNKETQAVLESYDKASGELGEFKKVMEDVAKAQADVVYKDKKGNILDDNSYQKQQMRINRNIKAFANKIRNDESFKEAFQKIGVDIQEQWFNIVDKLNENDLGNISSIQFDAIIKAAEGKHPQLEKALKMWQDEYNNMVPSDVGVQVVRAKFIELANEMGPKFIDRVKSGLMGANESLKDYRKRIEDTVNDLAVSIKSLNAELAMTPVYDVMKRTILGADLKDAEELKAHYDKILAMLPDFSKTSGGGSDNRLQNVKEEISLTKKLYDEYQKLEKQMGATKAAEKIQQIYFNTIKTLQERAQKYGFEFKLPFTDENLKSNMQHFIDKMKELQKLKDKKGKPLFPNIGKEIDEAIAQMEDVDFNSLQKTLEKKLKELADKISRTKTAKEFYDKILSQTGDINFATNVSMSIYGDTGKGLFEATVEQIKEAFKTGSEEHPINIDISAAIDVTNQRINYKMLADIYDKYKNDIIEKNRDTAKTIVRDGQKTAAENILTWQKELAKAKDFEEQRTDIINRETQRRAEIIKSNLPQEEKNRLVSLSYDKQAKDLSILNVDEFKASDEYIRVFQDLDKVSSQTLQHLKTRLEEIIATAKEAENIEGVKALVEALNKIKDEQKKREDPIKGMIQSIRDYRDARKELHDAEVAEAQANAEFKKHESEFDADILLKKQEQADAQQQVNDLKSKGLAGTFQMVTAELRLNQATEGVRKATDKKAKAEQTVAAAAKRTRAAQDKVKKSEEDFKDDAKKAADAFNGMASTIQGIADMFGFAEDSELGDLINGFVSGLQMSATILTTIIALMEIAQSSSAWLLAVGAAVAVFSGLFSWLSNSKVRKANREIERQQAILDQLEYSYGRLEKAAEKAFGGDYIKNFKDQQANLRAQIEATQKQLAAEQSKGKKTDDDKVKEYQEKIRDLKDQLADMQGQIAEHFLGTDLTSAARDFAKAWLDAYKEFGNTADAMSEKFQEMIENMVVEGAMAAVMERALKPMFDMIDKYEGDFTDENFWREVANKAEQGAKDANAGASIMMKFLEQAGLSIRELGGDLTGISRDIAGASEESINGLAATMNTWSYYVSYVPQIAQNVAILRAILEGGVTPIQSGQGVTDLVTLQNQSLTHLQDISRHTAETVTECQRIAERCTAMAEDIHRVVVPKGTKGNYAVQTQVS